MVARSIVVASHVITYKSPVRPTPWDTRAHIPTTIMLPLCPALAPRTPLALNARTMFPATMLTPTELIGTVTSLDATHLPTAVWTVASALAVLGIGQAFETITHTVRHAVPNSLLPVIEAILSEVTTLGFTGLLLSNLQASSEESWVGHFSAQYLGDAGELFELFEAVDHALFPTTVAFVVACAILISVVNAKFASFMHSTQTELLYSKLVDDEARDACSKDASSDTCTVASRRSNKAAGLLLEQMHIPASDGARLSAMDAFLDLGKPATARRAEFLRFRCRFIEQSAMSGRPLPQDFQFGRYLQRAAADNLRGLVSLEPVELVLVWLPLILIETFVLALSGGVDGDFLPSLFGLAQVPIGVWALWNYLRMHTVKTMLTPQLGVSTEGGASADRVFKLLPPRFAMMGGSFRQKSWLDALSVFERPFAAPAATAHDELFGELGSNGLDFYLASMRLVLFSSIVSLAYFGGGGGDAWIASSAAAAAACISQSTPLEACDLGELVHMTSAPLAIVPSMMAVLLTPFTFLNYNWASAVEGQRREDVADAVLREQREGRFRVTLSSLASLCTAIESALTEASGDVAARVPKRTAAEVETAWEHLLATQPPERLLDVRALFEAQDTDASGSIGFDEIESIVVQLGYEPTPAGVQALFTRMDVDGDGEVGFAAFATAVVAPVAPQPATVAATQGATSAANNILPIEYGKLFDFFDLDGSGTIDEGEMLLKLEGLGFDPRGVTQLFADIAGEQKGVVTRQDFTKYLEETSLPRQTA